MRGVGKRPTPPYKVRRWQTVVDDRHPHARIDILEARLSDVVSSVQDLAKIVKDVAAKPTGISWREVLATLATVIALYVGGTQIMDRTYKGLSAVSDYRIEQLEKENAALKRQLPNSPK